MSLILKTFTRNLLRGDRKIRSHIGLVDYALCIDIECTCDSPVQIHPMEIIEIACLKLDLSRSGTSEKRALIDRCPMFHTYVKPVVNPELTLFCQELTGISQETVEKSETIDKVITNFFGWLRDEGLVDEKNERRDNFAFASCGNFDINLLAPTVRHCQFNNNDLDLPIYFKEWINVKNTFVNHKREWPKSLYHMMELLDEEPQGRLHSARDDCKNLARILECLRHQGCTFSITNKLIHDR